MRVTFSYSPDACPLPPSHGLPPSFLPSHTATGWAISPSALESYRARDWELEPGCPGGGLLLSSMTSVLPSQHKDCVLFPSVPQLFTQVSSQALKAVLPWGHIWSPPAPPLMFLIQYPLSSLSNRGRGFPHAPSADLYADSQSNDLTYGLDYHTHS